MKKYDLISNLADVTAKKIVQKSENWKNFLNTSSRLYKYSFPYIIDNDDKDADKKASVLGKLEAFKEEAKNNQKGVINHEYSR